MTCESSSQAGSLLKW